MACGERLRRSVDRLDELDDRFEDYVRTRRGLSLITALALVSIVAACTAKWMAGAHGFAIGDAVGLLGSLAYLWWRLRGRQRYTRR
jgi:hypothetical protein